MDIEYLLALQGLRESLPGAVESFFLAFSFIGDGPALVALGLVVYWCVDKRSGQFALTCFAAGNFVNQLIKNLACVYRPWIRDDRIIPTADAIEGAGGYSFPSGHTAGTATMLGSFAWLARKKRLWISVVCIIVVLIIAFSRNFLGVHTPQDVLMGLIEAIVMIALTQAFFNWLDRYDALMPGHNKDVTVAIVVFVICIASIIIVALKAYPMDYVNGELLVEPEKMQKGSFEAAGVFMGFALGWVLERRIVSFSTSGLSMNDRIIRGVIGVAITGVTYIGGELAFELFLPYLWAKFATYFLLTFMALFVAPLAFDALERRRRTTLSDQEREVDFD